MSKEQESKYLKETVKNYPDHHKKVKMKTERLMSRNTAAGYLDVSISTLDNWTRAGLIERVKIGRAVRYTPESIENLIDENNEKRMYI